MGLLTDPTMEENPKKTFIVKYHGRLSVLMILSSIVWLVFLANDNFSAGNITKFVYLANCSSVN